MYDGFIVIVNFVYPPPHPVTKLRKGKLQRHYQDLYVLLIVLSYQPGWQHRGHIVGNFRAQLNVNFVTPQ